MISIKERKLRYDLLKIQKQLLIERWERQSRRDKFIKRNIKKITSLKMDGWPRLREMKDRLKWLDLVFSAKIEGVYSIGTSNCDVIAQLSRFAKEMTQHKNSK